MAHAGQDRLNEKDRALDEEVQLGEVIVPADRFERGVGLRPGRVQHEHLDGAEVALDRGDELAHLALVGHVCAEGGRGAATLLDRGHELGRRGSATAVVDRDGEPVGGQPERNAGAQAV